MYMDLGLGFQLDSIDNVSVFMPILCRFYYCSFVVQLEIRDGDASSRSFIVQGCFNYPELFVFPYEVENCHVKVYRELC